MTKPATVLLACEYADNYLRIGTRTFNVPPEDIRAAEAAAQKAIAEASETASEAAAQSEIAPSDAPEAPKPSRRRSKAQ